MPRYIDADELLKKSFRIEGHFDLPSGKAQNFSAINVTQIMNFPTADVAPVVFCKDCAYHKQCSIEDAMSYNKLPSDECFCSVGRRIKIKNGGDKNGEIH